VNGPNSIHILQNTIVAANVGPGNPDINSYSVAVLDHGGNFIGMLAGTMGFGPGTLTGNPKLGPLQNKEVRSSAFRAWSSRANGGPASREPVHRHRRRDGCADQG